MAQATKPRPASAAVILPNRRSMPLLLDPAVVGALRHPTSCSRDHGMAKVVPDSPGGIERPSCGTTLPLPRRFTRLGQRTAHLIGR